MLETKCDFVSLDRVDDDLLHITSFEANWFPKSQIGINCARIRRLCRLGGISDLSVVMQNRETSRSVPMVVGINGQGSAYAGRANVEMIVPEYKVSHEPFLGIPATREVSGRITINIDEMVERITSDKKWKGNIRSPGAWSHYLNRSLNDGITDIGLKNLQALGMDSWITFAGSYAPILGTMQDAMLKGPLIFSGPFESPWDIFRFPWILVSYPLAVMLLAKICWRISGTRDDRFSLYFAYGPQLDQALVLKVLSKTQTTVKPIS